MWVPAAVGESTGAVFRLQRPVGDWGQVHAGTPANNAAEATSHDNFLPGNAADEVAVVRVTDIVQTAAAIKIDVEGSEAAAMRSCERVLLDPALQLAAIEFQGSSDAGYSEGVFAQLVTGGMSAYIFQEEYFRFVFATALLCVFICPAFTVCSSFFVCAADVTVHRSIRSYSPRLQAFPIMHITQFEGLSRSKPFDDILFTRKSLPSSWLWDMKLTEQAHRDALQQLQHVNPHEQVLAASFLSRWSRNLGDMEYFAYMGDLVCRLHVKIGQLLRASNDCYILWSTTRNVPHALLAIHAQRSSGRWDQAETTLAELGLALQSSPLVREDAPLQSLAQAGVPGRILTLLSLQVDVPSASVARPQADEGPRGMALALVHCSNSAVAAVALALAQRSALLVCIGNPDECPAWCLESFGGIVDGQCSCEMSLQTAATGLGGGVGMMVDACKVDGGHGCAFDQVATVHSDAAAMGLPVIVYPDSYYGKHPLLTRAFVATHYPLHAPDDPMAFERSLHVRSLDIIRAVPSVVPAYHISGWGPSIPAHAADSEKLGQMIAHARAQHGAAASSSPIVFVLNAAAATPSVAADIAAASGEGAHIVLGSLLPDTARLWVHALLKLGAHSARLFWCDLSPHGPDDSLPYHEPRQDSGCALRLKAASVAADIVFDARPSGGSLVEVLQHCVWGALPAIASPSAASSRQHFDRIMHMASAIVGLVAPVRLSGAQIQLF